MLLCLLSELWVGPPPQFSLKWLQMGVRGLRRTVMFLNSCRCFLNGQFLHRSGVCDQCLGDECIQNSSLHFWIWKLAELCNGWRQSSLGVQDFWESNNGSQICCLVGVPLCRHGCFTYALVNETNITKIPWVPGVLLHKIKKPVALPLVLLTAQESREHIMIT